MWLNNGRTSFTDFPFTVVIRGSALPPGGWLKGGRVSPCGINRARVRRGAAPWPLLFQGAAPRRAWLYAKRSETLDAAAGGQTLAGGTAVPESTSALPNPRAP